VQWIAAKRWKDCTLKPATIKHQVDDDDLEKFKRLAAETKKVGAQPHKKVSEAKLKRKLARKEKYQAKIAAKQAKREATTQNVEQSHGPQVDGTSGNVG